MSILDAVDAIHGKRNSYGTTLFGDGARFDRGGGRQVRGPVTRWNLMARSARREHPHTSQVIFSGLLLLFAGGVARNRQMSNLVVESVARRHSNRSECSRSRSQARPRYGICGASE